MHTPTPWKMTRDNESKIIGIKAATDDYPIALIELSDPVINEYDRPDEDEANARLFFESPEMCRMIRALADEYTGRDPLALLDTDLGHWAEEVLARIEDRKPHEGAK